MWLHGFLTISSLQEETRGGKFECGALPLCCYRCCNAALTSGGVGGGGSGVGAGGYPSLDRYRGRVREDRILSLHVNRKVGGLWRGDRAGVGGWGSAAVAGCSVPSSLHVYSEVMSESGASAKLGPDGERILPENDSAAELRRLLLGSEGAVSRAPQEIPNVSK